MFAPLIGLSIIGRAVEERLLTVVLHNPLDALEREARADAPPYGGGPGMVLRLEPIARILDRLIAEAPVRRATYDSADLTGGEPLRQAAVRRLAALDRLIILCGRYEGIDERIGALYPCEEVSLGDFVLTGGEVAAMAILDAVARLREGAIRPESLVNESFNDGRLDFPAYTRPPRFRGVDVPAVLLSGDHAAIAAWRNERSRERTRSRRPDLSSS